MSLGFGFTKSNSKSTTRSGTEVDFPKQFLLDYNKTLGGPLTTGDLFRLAPRGRSLFGNAARGPQREGGGFNLGFGLPPASLGEGKQTDGTTPPPNTDGTDTTAPQQSQIYGINDILPAWDKDPEKRQDLGRFFRQSGLNPDGFTREEYGTALQSLQKYGFSGRSQGNFHEALALLRSDDELQGAIGGGRGSGIF